MHKSTRRCEWNGSSPISGLGFCVRGFGLCLDSIVRPCRYEMLMDRRPLLLSSVMLRQNPHNVDEWHKRVALFEGTPDKMVKCYTEAVKIVDNSQAVGRPHTLWLSFARM